MIIKSSYHAKSQRDSVASPKIASSPHPSPPHRVEERVPEGRRAGEEVLSMLVTDDHQELISYQIPKRIGGFAEERLLSPSLSSTPSGGEGARRAGEEVP